jgi:hypothetical protein
MIERFKGHWWCYLIQFPFEWWVTVSYKDLSEGTTVKSEYAKIKLKTWIRKIIKEDQLQIAYFGVLNQANRIHLHLLMLGRNRHGKTLLDVSAAKWERRWKAQAKIHLIYDLVGVSKYFERNMCLRNDTLSEIILYNRKLLNKVKYTHPDPNEMIHPPVLEAGLVKQKMVELIEKI